MNKFLEKLVKDVLIYKQAQLHRISPDRGPKTFSIQNEYKRTPKSI